MDKVVAAAPSRLDRLALTAMEAKRLALKSFGALVPTEDLAAALVKDAFIHELIDRPARLESGVQLNDRMRPEQPCRELFVHTRADLLVANHHEAPREVRVVVDEPLPKTEDVH